MTMADDDKLDPRLRVMLDRRAEMPMRESARRVRVGMAEEAELPEAVEVLVRGREIPPGALEGLGANVRVVIEGAETIASVAMPVGSLAALASEPWVDEIEAAREMYPELDLSIPECRANAVHALTPAVRGQGVLVGVIDGGIDFKHKDFIKADGTSR